MSPAADTESPGRGWSAGGGVAPTTVVLVRHGATEHTAEKRFSGGLAGSDPPLNDLGRAQAAGLADWLADLEADAVVSSPVLRARQTAAAVAQRLRLDVVERAAFAEIDFGRWEGLTFAEVQARHPHELDAWLGSLDMPPGGGPESFRQLRDRVLTGLTELITEHAGGTVLVVSHVTPIKVLAADALGAPLSSIYAMELAAASVSVLERYPEPDGASSRGSLRLLNARPDGGTLTLR